jgi:hypothetical protein
MPLEGGDVRSCRKVDSERVLCAFIDVILRQAFAYFASAHPDNAVVTEIFGRVPAEDVYRERSLLEEFAVPLQCSRHNVLEKRLTSMATAENPAGRDTP